MAEKIVKDSQGLAKDLVNDCISRQTAIDAIDEQIKARLNWISDSRFERRGLDVARTVIEDLPSVQTDVTDTNVGDIISRQAAIDAVTPFDDEYRIRDAIEDLPSAEPEHLTDDDFETIRIHLSAFKEGLCNQRRWKEAKDYERLISRFMSFASAQPENTRKRTETHACDLISRQAAIDGGSGT